MQVVDDGGRIAFRSPRAFYSGCLLVTAGVLLHLPMFIEARAMHYRLAGTAMPPAMIGGMAAIVVGLLLVAYGVTPPVGLRMPADEAHAVSHWSSRALDDVPLNREHCILVAVLGLALIIDIMKPATLAFTLPGMRAEYGLSQVTVTLLPFSALVGLTLGSFVWGWFGDQVGRRATILFAAIMFMGTSICGMMPTFGWNMVMCFIMGLSAGGLLPIAVSLLSEILPVRSRAPFIVLLAGIGAAGGYLVASVAAATLIPLFSWRVLWLLNLPTGATLLLLNRAIPESPRFLLSQCRIEEADRILRQFGSGIVRHRGPDRPVPPAAPAHSGAITLFRLPYLPQSIAVALYALSWGLVNYGFLLWLPTDLQSAGFAEQAGNAILAKSALLALLGAIPVAWLYARWSSKNTMLGAGCVTLVSLFALLPVASDARHHSILMAVVVGALLVSSAAMTSTLSLYTAEVYPTRVRGTGSGLAAGAGKFGGLAGQGAVLAHVTPALMVAAPLVAVPVALALVVVGIAGHETRGRRLEESSGEAGPALAEGVVS